MLDRALEAAGLDELPTDGSELKSFVQSSLRSILEDELGASLAREVANDLESALYPALRRRDTFPAVPSSKKMRKHMSALPFSRPGTGMFVVVFGADRFGTASLARALIADGFEVATAHDEAELWDATDQRGPDAILLDEQTALELPNAVEELIAETPALGVLAHNCTNPVLTDALLRAHGANRLTALPRGASNREVVFSLTLLAPFARV